jgi:hypothetical protein
VVAPETCARSPSVSARLHSIQTFAVVTVVVLLLIHALATLVSREIAASSSMVTASVTHVSASHLTMRLFAAAVAHALPRTPVLASLDSRAPHARHDDLIDGKPSHLNTTK